MKTEIIGSMTIDRVVEIDRYLFKPDEFFRGIDEAMVQRYKPMLGPRLIDPDSNQLIISFHSFVIRTPRLVILVDTCNGNHKERPGKPWQHRRTSGDYIANLAKLGITPEGVDVVLCTHLHGDHVGWNTKLVDGRWVPTFPNARYVISRREYDYFSTLTEGPPDAPRPNAAFADSVRPVMDAGRLTLVDTGKASDCRLDDGVRLQSAPGHTPDHVIVHAESGSGSAVLCGDVIHHPIQFYEPQLSNTGDLDPVQALVSRNRMLQHCAENRSVLLTGHFPPPTSGFVTAEKDGFRFKYRSG
jgi:glyoxylase-like metal-dependent hydrolase (beta-lactamase superfamily II)